jgi:hypothetical protein
MPMTGKMAPPEVVRKKFIDLGWWIGTRHEKGDVCPDCVKLERSNNMLSTKKIGVPALAAVPPRTMTREIRRLIFMKLNEIYLSEEAGYGKGWTDKRVAEDMDYPAAWIVTVREENFGPLRDNEDLRALREDMAKLERDRVVLDDSVKAIVANQTKLNARIDDLLRRAKEIAA